MKTWRECQNRIMALYGPLSGSQAWHGPLINNQINEIAAKQNVEFEQAKYNLVTAKQPLPEMMDPRQIGEFILFLCSDSARSITGASLPMDGAWTAQ